MDSIQKDLEDFLPIYQEFLAALRTTAPRYSINNGTYQNRDAELYNMLAEIARKKREARILAMQQKEDSVKES